jgi:hypothetical protein
VEQQQHEETKRTVSINSEHSENTGSVVPRVDCRVWSSLRSCPLLNTFPSCRSTTTLTSFLPSSVSSVVFNSAMRVLDSAFRFLSSCQHDNHSARPVTLF